MEERKKKIFVLDYPEQTNLYSQKVREKIDLTIDNKLENLRKYYDNFDYSGAVSHFTEWELVELCYSKGIPIVMYRLDGMKRTDIDKFYKNRSKDKLYFAKNLEDLEKIVDKLF